MLTGPIRTQIDQIWNAFWSGGVSTSLSVIEQLTVPLFIKRFDDLQTRADDKAWNLDAPAARRIFPEGADDKNEPDENLRWSNFKNFESREIMRVVDEHVFPFLRGWGEAGSAYGAHMKDARLGFSNPALLAKVVELLDAAPMADRDAKGDVYEYMRGKIASAGQNGQFRTPRHIIQPMVEMTAPPPRTSFAIRRRANICTRRIRKCRAILSSAAMSITTGSTASTEHKLEAVVKWPSGVFRP